MALEGREVLAKAQVTGADELVAMLRQLGDADLLRAQVLKPALMKTAKPVMAALAAGAPRSHGYEARHRRAKGKVALFTTMAINGVKNSSSDVTRVRIGPRYPAGAHGHLTEFGTQDRRRFLLNQKGERILRHGGIQRRFVINLASHSGRGWWAGRARDNYVRGMFCGRTPAQHWMQRTWSRIVGTTLENLQKNVAEKLEKLIKDLAQKAPA